MTLKYLFLKAFKYSSICESIKLKERLELQSYLGLNEKSNLKERDTFDEHYTKLVQVHEELLQNVAQSGSDRSFRYEVLNDLHVELISKKKYVYNEWNTWECIYPKNVPEPTNYSESVFRFCAEDVGSLFERPYDAIKRLDYFKSMSSPNFPKLPGLEEFHAVLGHFKLGKVQIQDNIDRASLLMSPTGNPLDKDQALKSIRDSFAFSDAYHKDFTQNPIYNDCYIRWKNVLINLSNSDLNYLVEFIELYENLSIVTLQPYMLSVLGNALFFKVVLPMHQSGVLHSFFKNLKNDIFTFRNSYYERAKQSALVRVTVANRSYIALGAGGVVLQGLGVPKIVIERIAAYFKPSVPAPEEESLTLVERINQIPEPEGLGGVVGETLDSGRDLISRVGVEIGKTVGVLTNGILSGWIEKHRESATVVAELLDDQAKQESNKKKKKS